VLRIIYNNSSSIENLQKFHPGWAPRRLHLRGQDSANLLRLVPAKRATADTYSLEPSVTPSTEFTLSAAEWAQGYG